MGIAINRKKLGLEIDYDAVVKEKKIEYKKNPSDMDLAFTNYCYYIIFEEKKYIKLSYEACMKSSNEMDINNKDQFFNCPWTKLITEE